MAAERASNVMTADVALPMMMMMMMMKVKMVMDDG